MLKLTCFTLLLILTSFQIALAQNYQPFRKNKTYYFVARDSVYSMQIDTAKVVGTDSVFVFNQTAKRGLIRTGSPACIGTSTYYHVQNNNQFGHFMKKFPNGDYIFHTAQGQNFLLKTQIPVNSSWLMNSSLNLSATLVSIGPETFHGVTDNVYTYNLNNGTQIKLSQHYGFVLAPNFTAFVPNSDFKRRNLQMHKLPETQSFNSNPKSFLFFDFQPGDKFSFLTDSMYSGTISFRFWDQYEILSRTNSPFGDYIYYSVQHTQLERRTHFSSAPTFALRPPRVITWAISSFDLYMIEDQLFTNGFQKNGGTFHNLGTILATTSRSSKFNNRERSFYFNLPYNHNIACPVFLRTFDWENEYEYTPGLGKTYHWENEMIGYQYTRILEAYIKGTETYGTWPSLTQLYSQLLSREKEIALPPISAYPNPFTSEVTLQFSSSFSAGKASVLVSNVLGQEVLKREVTVTPGQENKLELGQLPKGIYVLKAGQNGKVFSTRLVKE